MSATVPPLDWRDPPWEEPLDAAATIERIPSSATMNGLFLAAVTDLAKARGARLPSARESYVPFRPYLLREHATLLVEAANACWPDRSLREGLRRIGRGAPRTLLRSTLGRVVLGSVDGAHEAIAAMAKSYPLQTKPCSVEVTRVSHGACIVHMREVMHFLDSHHVGVFEGVIRHAGVEGSVRIHATSWCDADLLCEWRAPAAP